MEKSRYCLSLHLVEIDTDPDSDRQALNAHPDPYPDPEQIMPIRPDPDSAPNPPQCQVGKSLILHLPRSFKGIP
jgi:hypothetical protein